MTETPELDDAPATAQPSPKRPDRRPAQPKAQPISPSAEVDYLRADGEVTAGDNTDLDRTPDDTGSQDTSDTDRG